MVDRRIGAIGVRWSIGFILKTTTVHPEVHSSDFVITGGEPSLMGGVENGHRIGSDPRSEEFD
jgi:hypothetical protein